MGETQSQNNMGGIRGNKKKVTNGSSLLAETWDNRTSSGTVGGGGSRSNNQ